MTGKNNQITIYPSGYVIENKSPEHAVLLRVEYLLSAYGNEITPDQIKAVIQQTFVPIEIHFDDNGNIIE